MFLYKVCSLSGLFLMATFFIHMEGSSAFTFSHKHLFTTHSYTDTLEWPRPRFKEREEERHRMVEQHIKANGITDPKTLQAMRNVPRHLFIPSIQKAFAYRNSPLPIGHGQTISQPLIVAYMTQLLDLEAGEKVLEVGTGSGYQAAVLSELTPHVYTIEIVEELAKKTRRRLTELGYTTIKTKIGDGYKGWDKHAPFDAIILTAAAEEIPPPLIRQLKPNGIMVMPVGAPHTTQDLVKITKNEEDEIQKERLLPVRFVPMTGDGQEGN